MLLPLFHDPWKHCSQLLSDHIHQLGLLFPSEAVSLAEILNRDLWIIPLIYYQFFLLPILTEVDL